ncbi:MAG: DNA repair protein RecO [Pseudomonadota bacterium]|nr:DNA repair protein RecO [Pseudomonadota bacterium]
MTRVDLQPSYLLHSYAYRDTSLIVELLTREHGRMGLVARGVRGPKSRWRPLLRPFGPLLCSWMIRGELGQLTGVESGAVLPALQGDRLYSAYYMNELLLRLLRRQDSCPGVFDQYALAIGRLAAASEPDTTLRMFEKHLLQELGFGLVLEHEAGSDAPVRSDRWYRYDVEAGPRPSTGRGESDIPGSCLLALAEEAFSTGEQREYAKRLLRRVLAHHLGGEPLRSRRVMSELLTKRSSAERKESE